MCQDLRDRVHLATRALTTNSERAYENCLLSLAADHYFMTFEHILFLEKSLDLEMFRILHHPLRIPLVYNDGQHPIEIIASLSETKA